MWVWVLCVAGGGSGARQASGAPKDGGGGGESIAYLFKRTDLSATESVTIGAGGAARVTVDQLGAPGAQTSFGTRLTAKGGWGGGTIGDGTDAVAGTGTTAVADPGFTLSSVLPIGALRPFVMPAGLPIIAFKPAEDFGGWFNEQVPLNWPMIHKRLAYMIPRAASGASNDGGVAPARVGQTSPTLYSIGGNSSAGGSGSGTAGTGYGAGGGGGFVASGAGTSGYTRVITFS